ncbi:porin [Kiloniella laminariae]|uniref:Porin n=1 Tax=Kiloniella laminariae TaxID=454162 RepID=A0ABT4LJ83_9PROT|nr:porin [Kiloniella laminariae]MCZ4281165.1 porin [Kiloniella laminariae]
MKKILLASSAIVAAAAVSAPAFAEDGAINFNVFTQFHASSTDSDNNSVATNNGHDFNTNSEIKVSASNTADNGLKYGLVIELETDQSATNNVDENYIWLESDFGRVELGDQDGAANNLFVGGADVGLTYGMIDNPTGSSVTGAGADTAADVSDTGDSTKITYYTPSFNGFKAAVSYAPDSSEGNGVAVSVTDLRMEQAVEAGLNYSGTFNDFTLDVGAAGVFADSNGSALGAGVDSDDNQFWGAGVGFNVGYAGFKVGAGYTYEDGDKVFDNQNSVDAGISYTTGPWLFAVAGVWSETELNGSSEIENQAISAGVQYEVAPGLAVYGSAITGDYEGGSGDFTSAQTGVLVSF